MTNKTNLLLVAFMAIFLFSCAAEDPTTSSFGSAGDSSKPPEAGEAFDTEFTKQRSELTSWGADGKTTTVDFLANSFLVTRYGASGAFAALYIKPLGTGAYNSGNADLTYASDASSLATALANSGKIDANLGGENEQQHKYYDPRKLLTSEGGGLRMAWSGRVADPPEPDADGDAIAFKAYEGYNSDYKFAAGSGGGENNPADYGVKGTWDVYTYGTQVVIPSVGNVTTYVKSTDGSTRAWFWFLGIGGTRPEHYSTVSDPKGLGFGSGSDSAKEPRYNTTPGWTRDLNTAGTDQNNNVNPPGKMLFSRKTGEGISDAVYINNTAVFLSTVVGYNIKIKEHDEGLANTLYAGAGGYDAEGIASVHEYYMEFDADTSSDALAEDYDDAVNFPYWNAFGGNDGNSITVSSVKVQKFTGILLKMK